MLIIFVMLFIAISPTGNQTYYKIVFAWSDYKGRPLAGVASACFWSKKYWNGWRWDGALTYSLLISNYVARASALFESSEKFFRRNIRVRLLGHIEKALDRKVWHIRARITRRGVAGKAQVLSYRALLATYAVTLAFLELYSSFLAPLLWVLISLVWGSMQLLIPRTALAKSGAIAKENAFEFGQIIPLMLLTAPLVAVFESYYGLSTTDARSSSCY